MKIGENFIGSDHHFSLQPQLDPGAGLVLGGLDKAKAESLVEAPGDEIGRIGLQFDRPADRRQHLGEEFPAEPFSLALRRDVEVVQEPIVRRLPDGRKGENLAAIAFGDPQRLAIGGA